MTDGLALVFIEIDGHFIRVDRIERISPVRETSISKADPKSCYIWLIGGNQYIAECSPTQVLEKIARALAPLYGEPEGDVPDLDDVVGEEPLPPGTTKTRGGTSWGRG